MSVSTYLCKWILHKKPPSVYFAHLFQPPPPPPPMRKTNFFFKLLFNLDRSHVTIPYHCVWIFSGDITGCGNCKYFHILDIAGFIAIYRLKSNEIDKKNLHCLHILIECNLKTKHFDNHQKEHLNIFEEQAAVVNNGW